MENGVTTVSGTLNSAPIRLMTFTCTLWRDVRRGGTEGAAYTSKPPQRRTKRQRCVRADGDDAECERQFTATATGPSGGTSEFSARRI